MTIFTHTPYVYPHRCRWKIELSGEMIVIPQKNRNFFASPSHTSKNFIWTCNLSEHLKTCNQRKDKTFSTTCNHRNWQYVLFFFLIKNFLQKPKYFSIYTTYNVFIILSTPPYSFTDSAEISISYDATYVESTGVVSPSRGKNDTHIFVSAWFFSVIKNPITMKINHLTNTSITTGTDRDVARRNSNSISWDVSARARRWGRCIELACCHEFSFLLYFYRMKTVSRKTSPASSSNSRTHCRIFVG